MSQRIAKSSRKTAETNANGEVVLYSYNPAGDLLTLTDAKGRQFHMHGEIIAAANWRTWHNFESIICLTRWECDGIVSHGDVQECQWAEYIRLMRG